MTCLRRKQLLTISKPTGTPAWCWRRLPAVFRMIQRTAFPPELYLARKSIHRVNSTTAIWVMHPSQRISGSGNLKRICHSNRRVMHTICLTSRSDRCFQATNTSTVSRPIGMSAPITRIRISEPSVKAGMSMQNPACIGMS